MKKLAILTLLLPVAIPAHAADWVIGVGATDFSRNDAHDEALLELEVHAAPFAQWHNVAFNLAGGIVTHSNGDLWLGAGIAALATLGTSRWFLEASVMPGVYTESQGTNDLGSTVEFRSLIGLGYRFDNDFSVSLAATHKSNAGFGNDNPGVNALSLRFRRSF
ncbi:MAG: acyloxyacyl hydrolase [Paracoccaceae bacterium]|nr:acyloxyacyl hydrolase [Paracoccaceae bacterium]